MWWTAQDHRALPRAHHQLVFMRVALFMRWWSYTGFHHLGDCTFIVWSHLSYSRFTFMKDDSETETEVKILLLPPRTEVCSLVVAPAEKSPVTERGLEGRQCMCIVQAPKNSTAAPNTNHKTSLAPPMLRSQFVLRDLPTSFIFM